MVVLVRYGEIALKGKNRGLFEKRLVENIRDCLAKNNVKFDRIIKVRGRIIIETCDSCNCLKNVFGIVSLSDAVEAGLELGEIKKAAFGLYTKGSFRISTRRLEKELLASEVLNSEIGAYIVKKTGAPVNLDSPDIDIGIEIVNKKAYLFTNKERGPGGIPVGIEGKVAVLLEDDNSIEAAILMMKRGCSVVLVERKIVDYTKIKEYSYGFKLKTVKKIPKDALAVVVSDNIKTFREREGIKKPVFRPLIAY